MVGAEGKIGHHQSGFALTDDFVQVEVGPLSLGGQGVVAGLAQLDGNGVIIAGLSHLFDRFRAGSGYMRRANDGVLHTITVDLRNGCSLSMVSE